MEGSGAGLGVVLGEFEGAADRPGVPLRMVVEGKGEGAKALLAEVAGESIAGGAFFRVEASGRLIALR